MRMQRTMAATRNDTGDTMRFVGHTMATPGETVYDSIDLFRSLGFEGIEILCRPGTDLAPDIDDARAVRMADYAGYNGLPVVALTPWRMTTPALCSSARPGRRRAAGRPADAPCEEIRVDDHHPEPAPRRHPQPP